MLSVKAIIGCWASLSAHQSVDECGVFGLNACSICIYEY